MKEGICIYALLYFKNSILHRLFLYFRNYFSENTKPTMMNLFLIVISIITLDSFRSIRFAHSHVISKLTGTSLNAFYSTLKNEKVDHHKWNDVTAQKATSLIPPELDSQPLCLSIDDTLIEKFGKKFELCSRLYNHSAHDGSNYLNGHCMVSLLLSFPVWNNGKIHYLSVPLGYRLWDKQKTKIALAAELVTQAMKVIGNKRQVFLLCDSWYPKAEVVELVNQFENLDLICNVRVDTVLYDLPDQTKRRGRPSKHGKRLSIDQFELDDTQTGDWKIGMRPVMTKLWEGKIVYAFLTSPKKGNGKKRLFLCTKNPQDIQVCWNNCDNETIYAYGKENKNYLPIGLYSLRWNIEVSYYEEKTFWSLENYHVRSSCGIERLVNLQSIAYSAMTLLPYSDETFAGYKSASAQDTKYEISQEIQTLIILCSFGKFLETVKNSSMLIKHVENYVLSGIRKFQKL